MQDRERTRATKLVDSVWRVVLRLGFRLARVWWHIRRPDHQGALVAIYVGRGLLLVIPGWIAWGLISLWFLYRVVRGWLALSNHEPMPVPGAGSSLPVVAW